MSIVYRLMGLVMLSILISPIIFIAGVLLWGIIATAKLPTWDQFAEMIFYLAIFVFWAIAGIAFLISAMWLVGGAKTKDV